MPKEFPRPKVGDRVVSMSIFSLGRRGRRAEGYTDPAKRMTWVNWDDGDYSGEFLRDLIREKDYPKTVAYRMLKEK